MKRKRKLQPTDHQIIELLCDSGVLPSDYRIHMTRAFFLYPRGFRLLTIMSYMEQRGYINDLLRLTGELKPFFHRKLLRRTKCLLWNGHCEKRYLITKPKVNNPAYVPLFLKQDNSKSITSVRRNRKRCISLQNL